MSPILIGPGPPTREPLSAAERRLQLDDAAEKSVLRASVPLCVNPRCLARNPFTTLATGCYAANRCLLFNNDAIRGYEDDLDVEDDPDTPFVEQWGQATELLSPRFVRLSIQFDF